MKIVVFHKDEKVHDWFLNADDPNDIAFMVTNCGSLFVRYSIAEIRRMENELEEFKADDTARLMEDYSGEVEFWKSRAIKYHGYLADADTAAEEAWESIARPQDPQDEWDER